MNTSELTPLTPDILQRNGFEKYDVGGGEIEMWTGYGKDNEDDISVTFKRYNEIQTKFDVKGTYLVTQNIRHVQELQQMFKIAGVKKEIVL